MNRCKNQSTLLVEIMIAVLFFALCSTVILETYAAAREYSRRASVQSDALVMMQDIAEQMYAADDVTALLEGEGYGQAGDIWAKDFEDYCVELVVAEEATGSGVLRTMQIRAMDGDNTIAEIPGARYLPEGGAQ